MHVYNVTSLCNNLQNFAEYNMDIEEKTKTRQHRKSLAVDQDTYNLLEEICFQERRTKIDQLRMMIEDKHDEIFTRRANYEQRRRVNV